MTHQLTLLTPDVVGVEGLAEALRRALGDGTEVETNRRFGEALSGVIAGIRNHGRFDLLKRFVTHGSLLPPWDTHFQDTPRALDDDELANFVDFVTGHMVTKFQGCVAELLALAELERLVKGWKADGKVPLDATLLRGDRIRCLPRHRASTVGPRGATRRGLQGPDGIVATYEPRKRLVVHAVIEVKSGYVPPSKLHTQLAAHLGALRRGVRIGDEWCDPSLVVLDGDGGRGGACVARVIVQPARWLLPRHFRLDPTESGGRRPVMLHQQLPLTPSRWHRDEVHGWDILTLAWSRDAIRAAAFCLANGYMAEVGEALADAPGPDIALRTDMTPEEAGPNDLLHQLHVAVARQWECEPDDRRLKRTIELYNVLAFGWALGSGFRDEKGKPAMMYPEHLDLLVSRADEKKCE